MWVCPDGTGSLKKMLTRAEREKFSGFSFPPALKSCQKFLLSKTSWRPAATRAWETWSRGVSPSAVQGEPVGGADSQLAIGQPGNTSKTANLPQSEISKAESASDMDEEQTLGSETWQIRPEPGRRQGLGAGAKPASGVGRVTCLWLTLTGPSAAPRAEPRAPQV